MACFVLVHGAFNGGWYWKRVRARLAAAGHEVYTPTLTGTGERAHLLSRAIDLSAHIRDIVGVLEYEDLSGVILVGHSYGGMVISGVVDQIPERVARVVYFDAHVAADGKSSLDLMGGGTNATLAALEKAEGDGWLLPPVPLEAFGITDPADVAWISPRRHPLPMKCLAERISLTNEAAKKIPRDFVRCTRRDLLVKFLGDDSLAGFEARARAEGYDMYEIASGHDAMITHPDETLRVLLDVAAKVA